MNAFIHSFILIGTTEFKFKYYSRGRNWYFNYVPHLEKLGKAHQTYPHRPFFWLTKETVTRVSATFHLMHKYLEPSHALPAMRSSGCCCSCSAAAAAAAAAVH